METSKKLLYIILVVVLYAQRQTVIIIFCVCPTLVQTNAMFVSSYS